METFWIIAWRGTEEQLTSLTDTIDRWEQLDARGIRAEMIEVLNGHAKTSLPLPDDRLVRWAMDYNPLITVVEAIELVRTM